MEPDQAGAGGRYSLRLISLAYCWRSPQPAEIQYLLPSTLTQEPVHTANGSNIVSHARIRS